MFRRIIDRIKEAVEYLMSSRLIVLIIVFCLTSSILIGRLFYLQIVRGEDYLENYELQIRKTRTVPGTRGNIFDRNGEVIAYNELAYPDFVLWRMCMEKVLLMILQKKKKIRQPSRSYIIYANDTDWIIPNMMPHIF